MMPGRDRFIGPDAGAGNCSCSSTLARAVTAVVDHGAAPAWRSRRRSCRKYTPWMRPRPEGRRPRPRPSPNCSRRSSSRSCAKATAGADSAPTRIAGLTVAIVALPLSMAIAIGSGLSPDRGLYTAIVGGFLISALGGSRFQIGGPAGAFIVLIATIVERHGYDGLVLATLMAGADDDRGRLPAARHLYQVHPAARSRRLHGRHRGHHFRQPAEGAAGPRHRARAGGAAAQARGASAKRSGRSSRRRVALSVLAIAHHPRPAAPAAEMARAADRGRASPRSLALLLQLDVATIGSRFGGMPRTLPAPHAAGLRPRQDARPCFPDAVAIALLGAIEIACSRRWSPTA